MKRSRPLVRLLALALLAAIGATAHAHAGAPDPAADRAAFQGYFTRAFPKLPLAKYVDGPYNFSPGARAQWEQIMAFPPYGFALDHGKTLFAAKFPNGSGYAACFPNGGIGIAQTYPRFDAASGRVVTLPIAINRCRAKNGLPKL
ncbi:MAG: sulfur oxidation c-type cytochrome SoxA, partial [Rhodospirillales bacterium]|nr:sulfur oxidation c-type cytochrome SoxA [Rhodospirillales bacterium]